jgi:hypothetical protein
MQSKTLNKLVKSSHVISASVDSFAWFIHIIQCVYPGINADACIGELPSQIRCMVYAHYSICICIRIITDP